MNITRGNRKHAVAEPTDGAGSGTLGRRSVLGGLAALPVLSSVAGSATSASVAVAARPDVAQAAAGDLLRGVERRYNAPLLAPGTRLGEFGATNAWPYHNRFYTLALQPMSRNPYSLATTIR